LALAEAEQENRLLRARNERLERELAENARELGLDYEPAPVQPVWIQPDHLQKAQKAPFLCRVEPHKRDDFVPLHTTPPAAQRQWVGLTDEDKLHIEVMGGKSDVMLADMVEAKLKERNV